MAGNNDTIVAVSSPPGRSLRGLIRVSGPDAFAVLDALLEPRTTQAAPPARHLVEARLRDPAIPVLVARFLGPHSYTGEDLAELQLPGHPALLDRVIHAALQADARPAEPGEFTYRAYLAGRLDLTEAEGVQATIAAISDSQLAAATHLRDGALGRFATQRVDRLGTLLALVEAGIDFVDQEDVVPIAPRDLAEALSLEQSALRDLLQRSRSWGAIDAPPRVVLVGPPSAGKSTLMNALLGRDRAVTDALPGTTRDVLVEPWELQGEGEVLLVDVAGLDDPGSALDEQVQAAADRAIAAADLILLLGPPPRPLPPGVPVLRVQSRCDVTGQPHDAAADLHVSGVTGDGLDALRAAVAQRLGDRAVSVSAEMLALQPRHEACLRDAAQGVDDALDSFNPEEPTLPDIELTAAALRGALDALTRLGGQLTPDDIIGRVFATFCVGK